MIAENYAALGGDRLPGMEDEYLRSTIRLLVKAHKARQAHAAALLAILNDSASRAEPLTRADIEKELQRIFAQTAPIADAEARPVEDALNGGREFLELARLYALQQFASPPPIGTLL